MLMVRIAGILFCLACLGAVAFVVTMPGFRWWSE